MPKLRLGRSGGHLALFDLGQDVYDPIAEQHNLATRGERLCRCGRSASSVAVNAHRISATGREQKISFERGVSAICGIAENVKTDF